MRGLDGNYINTQGDATARMQSVYQSEVNQQQVRAQRESAESLRKLREQVNETQKSALSGGPLAVEGEPGTGSQAYAGGGRDEDKKREEREPGPGSLPEAEGGKPQAHIDIRV